jgi:hypothetical protein
VLFGYATKLLLPGALCYATTSANRVVLCLLLCAVGELMQLLAQDQAGVLEALDVHQQQLDQPDLQKELMKRIKL